jgi:hypothetical protein
MKRFSAFSVMGLVCLAVALLALGWARPADAQVTTGSVSGTVADPSKAPVPGASVTAVHTPTGTTYTGQPV